MEDPESEVKFFVINKSYKQSKYDFISLIL